MYIRRKTVHSLGWQNTKYSSIKCRLDTPEPRCMFDDICHIYAELFSLDEIHIHSLPKINVRLLLLLHCCPRFLLSALSED